MYKITVLILVMFSAMAAAEFSNEGFSPRVIGEAYDLSGKALQYREYHYYSDDDLTHQVLYLDTSENLMVKKQIDYRTGLTTPEFRQKGSTHNHDISISWSKNNLNIDVADNTEELSVRRPLVIDAGFDNFIREHWLELTSGQTLHFYFPLPKRSALAKLRVTQSLCSYGSKSDVCFSLEVSNWLLRLLVDPIELGYANNTRQLMRYRGLSNIENNKGEGLVVDIRYRYIDTSEACKSYCTSGVMTF